MPYMTTTPEHLTLPVPYMITKPQQLALLQALYDYYSRATGSYPVPYIIATPEQLTLPVPYMTIILEQRFSTF